MGKRVLPTLLVPCFLLAFPLPLEASGSKPTPEVKDFDTPFFEGVKVTLLDKQQRPGIRAGSIPRLVERNAREAIPVLTSLLDDPDEEVRRTAGDYLAMLGDKRGLDVQVKCVEELTCDRLVAFRLLGNTGRSEFAPAIATRLRQVLESALKPDGKWRNDSANPNARAFLDVGTAALARLGRKEDWNLIFRVIEARPDQTLEWGFLEALGYINDPRAKQVLWNAYEAMLKPPKPFYEALNVTVKQSKCFEEALGVRALLPLSRLGETLAIEKLSQIIRGVGTPEDPWDPGRPSPTLCSDRGLVFESLKPRDAKNFAETVFQVAAQEPEGPGTREAWVALGIMHPSGFGDRVLKLAMRKKPHWKFVGRQTLHDAIMAIDPNLNEAFWREYDVEVIPAHSGQKALVEMGLGRLMYGGARYWMDWTGD